MFADVAAEVVGEDERGSRADLIMASEDFSFMLEKVPGRLHQHRQRRDGGRVPVHNPAYNFNDEILPLGAAAFARIVEKKLPRFTET